jgi:PKD repeat protein
VAPSASAKKNFGWPCYEGAGRQGAYDAANLSLCESLYNQGSGAVAAPYYTYAHANNVVPNEACPKGGSAISGLAFYPTASAPYPAAYRGALFFADYARQCIWAMQTGTNGLPSASKIVTFAAGAARPVDLAVGPDGMLYYVDLGGTVRRFRYFSGNQPPVAALSATPVSGRPPLQVTFDATATVDPDVGDTEFLIYEWDFNYQPANGFHPDASATGNKAPTHSYSTEGTFTAALRVRDRNGLTDLKTQEIEVGVGKPTAFIDAPASNFTWATDQVITFSGHATDVEDGVLPASQLTWELVLFHCYPAGGCHEHHQRTMAGVASGSFPGPDHEYPSYLELRLTATDSQGKTSTSSIQLTPKTVALTFATSPAKRDLTVGADTRTTPFTVTVIAGSTITVSAPTTVRGPFGSTCTLRGWSDGGAATHTLVAPAEDATFTAAYALPGSPPRRCGGPQSGPVTPRRSVSP